VAVAKKSKHNFKRIDSKTPLEALEISIEDTGIGIHADELGKIFDRFYQIKERNEQYYSGTGIGLEVVKSFVELHKGDIEIESEKGIGTKFKIHLPLDDNLYNTSENTDVPDESGSETEISPALLPDVDEQQKKTRLIVEDNLELRSNLKQELSTDYKVLIAENGVEGLEKAMKYIPDVVITDIIMPAMDGIEFCTLLKKDFKTSHIPVLMLTAKSMTEDWVEGF